MKTINSYILEYDDIKIKKTIEPYKGRLALRKGQIGFKKAKQPVVKLISNLSPKSIKNALNYIIRNSNESFALDENGNELNMEEILENWKQSFSYKKNSKEAWHLIFSIDEEKSIQNIKALKKSVIDTMQKNFTEYKYVMVEHSHQNNPHIHVIINKNNKFTRRKMHFNTQNEIREFFKILRDDFADALNYYGLNFHYENFYKHDRDLEIDFLKKQAEKLDIAFKYNKIKDTLLFEKLQTNLGLKLDNLYKKIQYHKERNSSFTNKTYSMSVNNNFVDIKENCNFELLNYQELQRVRSEYDRVKKLYNDIKFSKTEVTRLGNAFSDFVKIDSIVDKLLANKELSLRNKLSLKNIKSVIKKHKEIVENKILNQSIATNEKISLLKQTNLVEFKNGYKLINILKDILYNIEQLNSISNKNADIVENINIQKKNKICIEKMLFFRYFQNTTTIINIQSELKELTGLLTKSNEREYFNIISNIHKKSKFIDSLLKEQNNISNFISVNDLKLKQLKSKNKQSQMAYKSSSKIQER
ncbi:MAG: relaxase/mobilization nuclease domain-containing protein [Endomicrobium sp.]|jgi:hypothetical protein|nr:relaxase/mobilization nuclease domain-containing protein [Endomicrobium sp.]